MERIGVGESHRQDEAMSGEELGKLKWRGREPGKKGKDRKEHPEETSFAEEERKDLVSQEGEEDRWAERGKTQKSS